MSSRELRNELFKRYKECKEGHLKPINNQCLHCYRRLNYDSNEKGLQKEEDWFYGLEKLTKELS